MTDHVYKTVEIVGSSSTDVTDAMRTAVARASQTLRHLDWVEVSAIRGHIVDGEIAHYPVELRREPLADESTCINAFVDRCLMAPIP